MNSDMQRRTVTVRAEDRRWAYAVETVPVLDPEDGSDNLAKRLAVMDADGWDLVSAVPVTAVQQPGALLVPGQPQGPQAVPCFSLSWRRPCLR